jgi:hypothetical protein
MTETIGPYGGTIIGFSYDELKDFLWSKNPDRSTANLNYVTNMTAMIEKHRKTKQPFSDKQEQWILSKIRFILKRNKTLGMRNKNIEGFKVV